LFDFVARGDTLRLTLMGRYIYGETSGQVVARNALGTIKLDFFITKRFYWFANAYFEQDTFQDLKLRTALGTGPGYQFIDKGDFGGIFSELTFYAEGGVAYFNEDFRTPTREDKSSVRARWAVNLNWPIVKDRIAFYHNHEGYPSLENAKDFYILTNTGAALNVNAHFIIKPQVTWRYNNAPAPGTTRSDTIYLITFGYAL
jgi:putative salt-induced outer membrane protein YdiY